MPSEPSFRLLSNRPSLVLVACTAILGLFSCAVGVAHGSLLGFGAAVAATWTAFVLGLIALYQHQEQLDRALVLVPVDRRARLASHADGENT